MPAPEFTITGNLFSRVADVQSGLGKEVTFTHNIPEGESGQYFVQYNGDSIDVEPVTATVNSAGEVRRYGAVVKLLANDAGLNVTDIQWTATIAGMEPFTFDAPSDGGSVDIGAVTSAAFVEAVMLPSLPVSGLSDATAYTKTLLTSVDDAAEARTYFGITDFDDVQEAANFAALPVTGETGTIYITLDTNKTYRWSGSAYVLVAQLATSTDITDSTTVGRAVLTAASEAAAREAIGEPLTALETSAGLIAGDIVNASYPPGHVYRYEANPTPMTTDSTTGLQNWLDVGPFYELDGRVDDVFRVTAQLVVRGGSVIRMGPQFVIYRDWAGTAGDKDTNACFKNENAPALTGEVIVDPGPWTPSTTDDDIYIEGGRIRPADNTKIGAGYYLMGVNNLTMRNPVVERTYQDWAFAIGGENFSLRGVRVEENAEVFEDGVHILYGSGVVEADYIHAGDDAFAVGTSWNLPVDGVDISMGSFHSEKANAIRVSQLRGGVAGGFATPSQLIQNVRFHSGAGKAGVARNGLIIMEAAAAGLLADVTVDGVHLDADTQTHDGTNPNGVYCKDVTRLRLVNITAKNARRHAFWVQNCLQPQLVGCIAKDSQGSSSYRALQIQDCLDARVVGGEYIRTLTHPVLVLGASSASFEGVLIREIGDNFAGIVANDTADVAVHGATFRKASAATASHGLRIGSTTATLVADGCIFGVDRPIQLGATPKYVRVSKTRRSLTIASDAITTYGDDYIELLCQGGVSDSLATITNGYKGQILTLVNAEASPATNTITVTAGTGSNQPDIGANFVLNSATAFITLYFDGTNWKRVQTVTNGNAVPIGSIELGHASDTTMSRLSAGQPAVEGNPLGVKVAVPSTASSTGVVGQWAADATHFYACVAANTWVRAALATW